jgi:hypothetical protein
LNLPDEKRKKKKVKNGCMCVTKKWFFQPNHPKKKTTLNFGENHCPNELKTKT